MVLLPQLPPSSWVLRMNNSFTYILRHAQLLSSTLVCCGVMFGYQCFIFIHREFSNIAYYIYTHTCTQRYIYTCRHSPAPRQLFHMGSGMDPHLCLDQQSRSSRGWWGGQSQVLTAPEPGLFQGKALCNWLVFFLSFSPCASPTPRNLCTKAVAGNVGKELHLKEKGNGSHGLTLGPSFHEDPAAWILAPFQDVWPVTLRPKGLGRTRGLGSGGYRLCLGSGVLSLLRKPKGRGSGDTQASSSSSSSSPPPPALRLSLLSVRRCGHADSFFFLELGRSAPTGPGELWLQAPDAVVAQSIHETVLAAMKRLGDGSAGGRAEPLPRDPPTSAYRPSTSQPYATLASAAQSSGPSHCRGLGERRGKATLQTPATAASQPEGLERGGGYIAMGAQSDYEPMGGGEAGGYMVMAPPRLAASAPAAPHHPLQGCGGSEYVPMSRSLPGSSPSSSLPRSYELGAGGPGPSFQGPRRSIGERWGPAAAHSSLQPPSELAGEYVCIKYVAPDYLGMGSAIQEAPNGHLNYVDLDLIPPLEARGDAPGSVRNRQHSYACIEFQNLREAPGLPCVSSRPKNQSPAPGRQSKRAEVPGVLPLLPPKSAVPLPS
ncbi:uncharacterized protein [Callorhinus ursinus]|uniref:uncharacterized protein isoform X1 n=1 Tax=Callorhinus ursinus TaxID=34884 RepID=UPI003CD03AE6